MVLNWQMFRLHVVPQLRDATVRSRALGDGNISPWCVPGRLSVASFSLHASQKWPRAGKSAPSWQHITAMHPKRAGVGKICAPCIRKAPQIAFRECIARRSCQGGALFAALTPRIMHDARILPFLGVSFGCCGRGEGRGGARGAGAAHAARAPPLCARQRGVFAGSPHAASSCPRPRARCSCCRARPRVRRARCPPPSGARTFRGALCEVSALASRRWVCPSPSTRCLCLVRPFRGGARC